MTNQPASGTPTGITVRDVTIPSDTPGIELFLRNKVRAGREPIGALLLVHGATFSSISLFDVDFDGMSFLDALALAGFDVWALDVRGYGGSTRPPTMEGAPAAQTPLVRATEAAGDVARALAHIRRERSPRRIALLGMSWGGSVAGIYASRHDDLDALVLVAPLWLSETTLRIDAGAPIMTHREVDVDAFQSVWLSAAPPAEREHLLPREWFDLWAKVTAETDAGAPPGWVRAPGGAVADVREHWTAGRPLYDPAAITAPTLIIRGTWDVDVRRDMALDLFDRMTNARTRSYLEIASGTHMILSEPIRWAAYAPIISFLNLALSPVPGRAEGIEA